MMHGEQHHRQIFPISNSISAAGFSSDYRNRHIAKHDVYGERFRRAWIDQGEQEIDPLGLEILGELDDLVINDE